MPNYQDSKIYKIVSLNTDKEYIGSTTQPLCKRLANHLTSYKSYKNGTGSFTSSYKVIDDGNYRIYLIENYPCNSKEELEAREGYHIRKSTCVNQRIQGRTTKEYYQVNKQYFQQYFKKYNQDNKKPILCECGVTLQNSTTYNINRHINTKKHQSYMNNASWLFKINI